MAERGAHLKSQSVHSELLLRCKGQIRVEMPVAQVPNDVLRVVSALLSAKRCQNGSNTPSSLCTPLGLFPPPLGYCNCAWPAREAF